MQMFINWDKFYSEASCIGVDEIAFTLIYCYYWGLKYGKWNLFIITVVDTIHQCHNYLPYYTMW